jgi:hypothetical protein
LRPCSPRACTSRSYPRSSSTLPAPANFFGCFRGFTRHQLVEIALLAARGFVLHQEREITLLELVEPIIPGNFFERVFAGVAGEIETDHPDIIVPAGAAHAGRACLTFFGPVADFFAIGKHP